MFGYARLRLGDAEASEEAVQEALLGAWRSRESFNGRSSERTWLIGILRHKVLDAIAARTKSRFPRCKNADPGPADELFSNGFWAKTPTQWGGDPNPAALRRAIADALETLPDQMRQAVVLREVDGLSGRVVCEILGITETNLWTLVHRAKSRLRVCLDERFGPGSR